jgi:triacylglycerol lipase
VAVPSLSKTRGIIDRAKELRTFLQTRFPNEKVHLITHSMGGLDARYMISRLGMADGVASLTTLGTPHLGSPFADWAIKRFRRLGAPLFRFFGISTQAFCDLTTESCKRFNEHVRDVSTVRYFSIAGRCKPECVSMLWKPPSIVVGNHEGDNDSMVSVKSACRGEVLAIWDADHMNLVNRENSKHPNWRGRPQDYAEIAQQLHVVEK